MSKQSELQDLINNPLTSASQRAEAQAMLDALDNPVLLVPESEVADPRKEIIAKMLAQLNEPTETEQTPEELWDERFRIIPLKAAIAANPNTTGSEHSNAADKLRNDPAWRLWFVQTYGERPSPVVPVAPPAAALEAAPKPKLIMNEETRAAAQIIVDHNLSVGRDAHGTGADLPEIERAPGLKTATPKSNTRPDEA